MTKKIKEARWQDPFAQEESQKYEHPVPSRAYLLEYLMHLGRPQTERELMDAFQLTLETEKEGLSRRLHAMVRDDQLIKSRRGAYGVLDKTQLIQGVVIAKRDGRGLVIDEKTGQEAYINARQMRQVFHGDRVLMRALLTKTKDTQYIEGGIVEILERNTHRVVGQLSIKNGVAVVMPENRQLQQEILIPFGELAGANDQELVTVEIVAQPSLKTKAIGKIIEVIGNADIPGIEAKVTAKSYGIPDTWPAAVHQELQAFSDTIPASVYPHRRDLTKTLFVTIDGEDAKDFDDAVSVIPRAQGGWTLYVAIADVSFYVLPQTALDEAARLRGNSTYFPNQVIPMLPEKLSNELCSLNPHTNRLTLVCEMIVLPNGEVQHYTFYEAVICSKARLTYTKVARYLTERTSIESASIHTLLDHLYALYHTLYHARITRGALEIETVETQIVFGKNQKIERILPIVRNDAHRIIEECMLLANVCAARFLLRHKVPSLFRNHEPPPLKKLQDLKRSLACLGLRVMGGDTPSSKDFQHLLQRVRLREDKEFIQTLVLRSMSQAEYGVKNQGHFGLAYKAYTNFTSPIRRYPDLLVHRAIKASLTQTVTKTEEARAMLDKIGAHCSLTERRSDEATRSMINWLKCEYMMDKIECVFSGVVTGVTGFGVFVTLKELWVEGLVHIARLKQDYYQFDPLRHELRGQRTGTCYRLGSKLKVRVIKVDLTERRIDFEWVRSV